MMLCHTCHGCFDGYAGFVFAEQIGVRDPDSGLIHAVVESSPIIITRTSQLLEWPQCIFGHHRTAESWWDAKKCCRICQTLPADVHATQDLNRFGYFTMFSMEVMEAESASQPAHVKLWIYHMDKRQKFEFHPYSDKQKELHAAIQDSTADVSTWSLVETWLKGCNEKHNSCNVARSFTPARLLRRENVGGVKIFRLVTDEFVEPRAKYATLSHCWGKGGWDQNLTLTRLTWNYLAKGKAVDALPKTFRDVFTILERLGLDYIWIDRFCILQDSAEDWRHQAAQMHLVYKGSYVCIAAMDAEDDDGGCFYTRNPYLVQPLVVRLPVKGTRQTASYVGAWDIKRRENGNFFGAILTHRAWALQERLLSPRTIYWGIRQVHWECREMHCSETQPDMENTYWYDKDHGAINSRRRPMFKRLITSSAYLFQDPNHTCYEEWYNLLREYSVCQMTRPWDKLVAISGVAKEMQRYLAEVGEPTTYFAGLWGSRLPQALNWYIIPASVQRHRPDYRAPSWSWAAVDGALIHRDETVNFESPFARVIRAETTSWTEDKTGQITGGRITLESILPWLYVRSGGTTDRTTTSSCLEIAAVKTAWHNAPVRFGDDAQADAEGQVCFDTLDDVQHIVAFLPVTTQAGNDHFTYGMALVESDQHVWKRVGHVVVNVHGEDNSSSWRNWLLQLPRTFIDID